MIRNEFATPRRHVSAIGRMLLGFAVGVTPAWALAVDFTWSGTGTAGSSTYWDIVAVNGWDNARGDGLPPQSGDVGNVAAGRHIRARSATNFLGTLNIAAGAQLNVYENATVAQLDLNGGTLEISDQSFLSRSLSGPISFTGNSTIAGGCHRYLGGVLSSAAGAMISVTGSVDLIIQNTNNLGAGLQAGWDIRTGTLRTERVAYRVVSQQFFGTGNVHVASSATFLLMTYVDQALDIVLNNDVSGHGTVAANYDNYGGAVDVEIRSTLAPGDAATPIGSLTLQAYGRSAGIANRYTFTNASIKIDLAGVSSYDQIVIEDRSASGTGRVGLNSVSLNLVRLPGFHASSTDTFTIINVTSNAVLSGGFSNVKDGRIRIEGGIFNIAYNGGDGNDVVLSNWTPGGTALYVR